MHGMTCGNILKICIYYVINSYSMKILPYLSQ